MNYKMRIKCTWDKPSRIITVICVILSFFVIYEGFNKGIVNIILAILLYIPFLFRPKYMMLMDNKLIIHMPLYKKEIDLNNYELVSNISLKGAFRVFATGGLAGYMGIYYSSKIGLFHSYLTKIRGFTALRNKQTGKIILVNQLAV